MQTTLRGRLAHLMLARAGVQFPVDALGIVAGLVVTVLLEFHPNARPTAPVNAQPEFLTDQFPGQLKIVEFDKVGGEVGHKVFREEAFPCNVAVKLKI